MKTSHRPFFLSFSFISLLCFSFQAQGGSQDPDDLQGYWKKTFADEFKGPSPETSRKEIEKCYQVPPRCIDLYNNWDLPCSSTPNQTFPGLAMLNKCVWNVHRSVNWMSPKVNEFTADQVEVRSQEDNGILVLRGNSVYPNGTVRPPQSLLSVSNMGTWMGVEGYNCSGSDGSGQADPALRKCPIRSGMVTSVSKSDRPWPGFMQQYGIIQVRGTISSGDAAFPAYWMLPDASWPGGGEFDLMESWNEDQASQTFHTGVCVPNGEEDLFPETCTSSQGKKRWKIMKGENIKYKKTPTQHSFFTHYHNFSLEWDANRITFRTDGVKTNQISEGDRIKAASGDERKKQAVHIPRRPFYVLLNQSVGNGKDDYTPNPLNFREQTLKIDYVRAWQKCSAASDFCPNGGTFGNDGKCTGPGLQYSSPCTRCLYGGSGGNPNCQIMAFSKPQFIPGIQYWVDGNPRWPGVYYKKIGGECPAGGVATDGNCQVKTFGSSVSHVPVPGVNYWVDTNPSWPGIFYKQTNGACNYGGIVSGNGNCQWGSLSGLHQGVQYWVDGNPRWPGVYYHGNSGSCPHGGVPSGNGNCQFKAFSVPASAGIALWPGVQYWLDSDPRWPGVYYKRMQGTCPVGGVTSGNGNCQLVAYPLPSQPYLAVGQEYWVDADPRWPGIYYKQIQGTCRYGGTPTSNNNCQLFAFSKGALEDQIKYWVDANPRWPGVFYRATY